MIRYIKSVQQLKFVDGYIIGANGGNYQADERAIQQPSN